MDGIKKVEEIKYLLVFRDVSDKYLLDKIMDICFKHGNVKYVVFKEELEERDKLENEILRRMSARF